jgi:HSP20 family protein
MLRRNTHGTALTRRGEGALAPISPWEEIEDLRRHMDDLFSRVFGYTPLSRLIPSGPAFEPAVDLYETDDKVMLYATLPGFSPDAIHVETTPDTVTIQGERKALFDSENQKAVAHRQGWVASEGSFSVSYTLPCEIDPNKVKATFRNGVLELDMPKSEHAKTKAVKIKVQPGS